MDVGYYIWRIAPEQVKTIEILGFQKRDGFWDKTFVTPMKTDYVKIFC